MKRETKSLLALSLAFAVLLVGCAKTSVQGITLNAPAQIGCGQTAETGLSFLYDTDTPEQSVADALAQELAVSYTVSDPAVLSVDAAGTITALAPGSAVITAADKEGKITATQTVSVVIPPREIVMPTSLVLNLKTNSRAELKASVTPEEAAATQISYSSADPAVATVDANGVVSAVGAGTTTLTAAVSGYDVAATCAVSVQRDIITFTLSDDTLTLAAGETAALTYTTKPENEKPANVEWETSDASIATVSEDGIVTAVGDGACTISLTVGELMQECNVAVGEKAAAEQPQSGAYGAIDYTVSEKAGTWCEIQAGDPAYTAIVARVNAVRAEEGLPALTEDNTLDTYADSRCKTLSARGEYTLDGAIYAEIVLAGDTAYASDICDSMEQTDGYKEMIQGPSYTRIGVGCRYSSDGKNRIAYWCVALR